MLQRYLFFSLLFLTPFLSQAQSLEFVRNDGQWDAPFAYKAETGKGDVFLSEKSITYLLGAASNPEKTDALKHGWTKGPIKLDFHAYRLHFDDALTPKITDSKEQSWYYNYFLGKDPSRWKSNIHPALAVDYTGLYQGIDMHVASDRGNMKYEFMVSPHADPSVIKLRFEGPDALTLKGGNLIIKTSVGDVQELKPYAYQYTEEGRKEVPCRYRLKGNRITYDLYDGYDASKLLVIDPTIVFSTFTGSTADNWGFTATYDAQGNFYGGGAVLFYSGSGGGSFPVSPGAFQVTFGGGVSNQTTDEHGLGIPCDIGIIKFNPTGTTKLFATYIGGSDNEVPHSMIVDANNNLIIGGKTSSPDFPVTTGAYDGSYNGGGDIYITKLNSTGTALVGSTYMGGTGRDGTNFSGNEETFGNLKYNYGDDSRSEVLVDNAGNIYLAGSSNSTDFPTLNAQQTTNAGGQDAVIMKLNPTLSTLLWSTYLGGTNDDAGYVMALNNAQTQLYVGGGTMSSNFPFSSSTWHSSYQGGFSDGYIARFANSGTYTRGPVTSIGTTNLDQVYGVQVDFSDNVYAMGQSLGGAFPVTAGTYSNANSSQFIIKLNSGLSSDLMSTVYGSSDPNHTNISPVAFLVDTCENIYISGWGGNLDIPTMPSSVGTTTGLPTTANAFQGTTDGADFYFIVLSRNAQSLLYGSFYGRNNSNARFGEHVDGGTSRFDKTGVVYQAICGGCGGGQIPTTPGSYSPTNGSINCNLASLKIAFELGAVDARSAASPNASGCAPFTVQFQNNSVNATSYIWDFGDNTATSNQVTPQHTFSTPGTYRVRLIASNPNACSITVDSAFLTIIVTNNGINSDFTYHVQDSCGPYTVQFTNTSQYSPTAGSQGFTRFTWLFGDNTTFTGTTPPLHTYPNGGTYTVTLIMRDSTACNSPDSTSKTFTVNASSVAAGFNLTDSLCEGSPINFSNTSQNAQTSTWDFGDNTTSTAASPVHTYATAGTYTVKLVVTNDKACNGVDSLIRTVTVKTSPVADFTFTPVIPVPNTPTDFHNASRNATDYTWAFGDGTSSIEVNPTHQYRRTGNYTVCLEASNRGCKDTVCKTVASDVLTGAELPTAFSPNGDGSNDVFYVRGGAIETSNLKIFNRWGQLVFESSNAPPNDPAYGWDGTYKGKQQEIEVYGWVLNVTFIDGTTSQRKGNVTLLR